MKVKASAREAEAQVHLAAALQGAQFAKDMEQNRQRVRKAILGALRLDEVGLKDDMKKVSGGAWSKCMFLFVIVGCELDLYGFAMSFPQYFEFGSGLWDTTATRLIMRGCCLVGPVGYLLAVLMYMCLSKPPDNSTNGDDVEAQTPAAKLESRRENPFMTEVNKRAGGGAGPQTPVLHSSVHSSEPRTLFFAGLKRKIGREPIKLQLFHFLPIVRYYLIIKDQEPSDVEGVFRVNSLSSFTLGIAQIICMMMSKFVLGNPLNVFFKINIASQCVNWSITILYFASTICKKMKSVTAIDALNHNSDEELKRHSEDWYKLIQDHGTETSSHDKETEKARLLSQRMDSMKQTAINEIRFFSANAALEMEILNWEQLHEMRGFLRRRFILSFADIGALGSQANKENFKDGDAS